MTESASWKDGPCFCPLCLVMRVADVAPAVDALAGTYVVTTTTASGTPRLCLPAGCPADASATARLITAETVDVPGAVVNHRAGDFVSLCDRVACYRLPEQQRRIDVAAAMPRFLPSAEQHESVAALLRRARRTKSPQGIRKLENELLVALRHEAETEHWDDDVPAGMAEVRHALYAASWQRLIAIAAEVATAMPSPPQPRLGFMEGVTAPGSPFEVTLTWRDFLAAMTPFDGVLLWALRGFADHHVGGAAAVDQVTIRVDGAALPAFGRSIAAAMTAGRPVSLQFDPAAQEWLDEHVWQRWAHIHSEPDDGPHAEEACAGRQWWNATQPHDEDGFPEAQHDSGCRGHSIEDFDEAEGWLVESPRSDCGVAAKGADVAITSSTEGAPASVTVSVHWIAHMRLLCMSDEGPAHRGLEQFAWRFARAISPQTLYLRLEDVFDGDGRIAERGELQERGGQLWLRRAVATGPAVRTRRAAKADLPANFSAVLARRRSGYDSARNVWRYGEVWGLDAGPDLSRAHEHVDPSLWGNEVDQCLLELLDAYGPYAPSVFAGLAEVAFPTLGDAASSNPLLATTTYALFGAWDEQGFVAALAFSRLRSLRSWDPLPMHECPLCGDWFDGNSLRLRQVRQFGPPRWCGRCLDLAKGAIVRSEDEALAAIAHLAEVDERLPTATWYTEPLPANLPTEARDRRLAARMAMPDTDSIRRLGLSQWSSTLARAGLLPDGLRTARGIQSAARDGHWCGSLFERAIDDYMSASGIDHEVQPHWPIHPRLNPAGNRRADWRLPDGTMIEAAGMLDEPAYAAKMLEKQQLADDLGVVLVIITPRHLTQLPEVFARWMP